MPFAMSSAGIRSGTSTNPRPYTAISRNWDLSKFGGCGLWLNDQLFMAHLAGLLDQEIARENLAVALASATPQGNLACMLTARNAWVDRTQIPVASFLLWLAFSAPARGRLLELAWPVLSRNHDWWLANRDPEGQGFAPTGPRPSARASTSAPSSARATSSSMDNAPVHDEAEYDPATRTLTTLDVGLNSLLALDAEMLALIAAELGEARGSPALHGGRQTHPGPHRGPVLGREPQDLRQPAALRPLRPQRGPTSFYPLVAGAVPPERLPLLLAHLDDPARLRRQLRPALGPRDDPAFNDNTYWRGRVWPTLNWLVWQGLRRAGEHERATALAERSLAMFHAVWEERRLCPENYNADTGEPLDQPDTEGFYGWGALIPALGVAEVTDVSPWEGWSIVNRGDDLSLGPLLTPAGRITVSVEEGALTLRRCALMLLRTTAKGRITHLELDRGRIAMRLPEQQEAARMTLAVRGEVMRAELNGTAILFLLHGWLRGAGAAHRQAVRAACRPPPNVAAGIP